MDPVHGDLVVGFSSQASVADFLKRMLESAGFRARAVWSGVEDLEAAIRESRPVAIVYEIGFPFDEQWSQFLEARSRPAIRNVPIAIATPARCELYRRTGVSAALEIFTRPADCDIQDAVHAAIATQPVGPPPRVWRPRSTGAGSARHRVNVNDKLRDVPPVPTAETVAR